MNFEVTFHCVGYVSTRRAYLIFKEIRTNLMVKIIINSP